MARTYHYLEQPECSSSVAQWFRDLRPPPVEIERDGAVIFYFRELGELARDASGATDAALSPLVTLIVPDVKRGILWTGGEVHFLTKRRAPCGVAMMKVQKQFEAWLDTHTKVFDRQQDCGLHYDYCLEGSLRDYAETIFALTSAIEPLRAGRYFVHSSDNEEVLDRICRLLRLRGISCCKSAAST